ncbi:MAG: restriction endonuclease subunit S, partial [Flavobacteriales bacterium]|nr:restriction endonuclease subunit S [Flavobacteriales bacterium]
LKEQYGKGVKFINVLDILNNDFITYENIVGKVDVDSDIIEKFSVQYGDVLFQRSSETREEVGTANVYLDEKKNATFGGFVIRGRKIGDYEPTFFNNLLKTDSARESITTRSGGSTRFNVGQEVLSSIALYFPPLEEQKKISTFLTVINSRIHTQKKIISHLETSIRSYREKLFSQKFRFKDKLGYNFADWKDSKLENICQKQSSNISANKIEENFGSYTIYGASGILKKVDFYEEENEFVSIVKDGAGVGRLFLCEAKSSVLGTMDIIKPKPDVNIYFLFYQLSNIDFTKYVTGSTIPHIYFRDYKKVKLKIPSDHEQTKIANFLFSIDEKIEIEKKILKQFENQKKYLLTNLFV